MHFFTLKSSKIQAPSTQTPLASIGLGLWKIPKDQTKDTVYNAIEMGYRHLDSACDYGNEIETGQGIAAALEQNLIKRSELFVTSKLWNTYHRPEHVRPALIKILKDLQLEHLNAFLVHFPIALAYVDFETRYPPEWLYDPQADQPHMKFDRVPLHETWAAMEDLVREGLVEHIGVCNYSTALVRDLINYAQVKPSIVQVECHPFNNQKQLLRLCQTEGIHFTGFSPLGGASYVELGMADESDQLLTHPVVTEIAKTIQATPAQVLIQWALQRGSSVVVKSTQAHRLVENLAGASIMLPDHGIAAIDALNKNQRYNDPGVFCEAAFNTFCPIYD